MIRSFAHKGLERFFRTGDKWRVQVGQYPERRRHLSEPLRRRRETAVRAAVSSSSFAFLRESTTDSATWAQTSRSRPRPSSGSWSVVSLAVSRRTREIAVRMAVGAERVDISRLILSRALASVTLGLVLGLTLSYVLAGLVRGLLFGVEPTDPLTLAAGVGVLVLSALSAAYLPARRAAAVDPTVSLRHE